MPPPIPRPKHNASDPVPAEETPRAGDRPADGTPEAYDDPLAQERMPDTYDVLDQREKEELHAYLLKLFHADIAWRDETLGIDFARCERLYEAGTGDRIDQGRHARTGGVPDKPSETAAAKNAAAKNGTAPKVRGQFDNRGLPIDIDGLPRVNLIHRAIEDHVAVLAPNIPDAVLEPSGIENPGASDNPLAAELRAIAREHTVEAVNAHVDTILTDSESNDHEVTSVRHAGIYGLGYLTTGLDRSADDEYSFVLRELYRKAEQGQPWSLDEAEQFAQATKRIEAGHANPKEIVWQAGVAAVGKDMRRGHRYQTVPLREARLRYDNRHIQPCTGPASGDYYTTALSAQEAAAQREDDVEEVVTLVETYQKVKRFDWITVILPGGLGQTERQQVTRTYMVRTVIGGGQVLEYEVWSGDEGSLMFPWIPVYIWESLRHPYGYAHSRALELSEMFINKVRVLTYQTSLRSSRPGGVAVWTKGLSPNDRTALQRALAEGGLAYLDGNKHGAEVDDIRRFVMPLSFASSPPDPSLLRAMEMELEAFRIQSDTVDPEAMQRARTGSAKRAQMTYSDRLRTIPLLRLGRAKEALKQSVYELVRAHHRLRIPVAVQAIGGGRQTIMLNERYRRRIPRLDRAGRPVYGHASLATPDNPDNLLFETIDLVVNDTAMQMKARADGRGGLPMDPISRHQFLSMLVEAGDILPQTRRRLALERRVRDLDDYHRAELARQQAAQQQRLAQQQQLLDQHARRRAAGLGISPDRAAIQRDDNLPAQASGERSGGAPRQIPQQAAGRAADPTPALADSAGGVTPQDARYDTA